MDNEGKTTIENLRKDLEINTDLQAYGGDTTKKK